MALVTKLVRVVTYGEELLCIILVRPSYILNLLYLYLEKTYGHRTS